MRKVLFIALVLAGMLAGCFQETRVLDDRILVKDTRVHLEYDFIEIEGMPCLVVHTTNRVGIACDWSQWESERQGGVMEYAEYGGYWVCPRCRFRYVDSSGMLKTVLCPKCVNGRTVLMVEVIKPEIPVTMTPQEYEDDFVQAGLTIALGDDTPTSYKRLDSGKYMPMGWIRGEADGDAEEVIERVESIMKANAMEE